MYIVIYRDLIYSLIKRKQILFLIMFFVSFNTLPKVSVCVCACVQINISTYLSVISI